MSSMWEEEDDQMKGIEGYTWILSIQGPTRRIFVKGMEELERMKGSLCETIKIIVVSE